MHFKDKVAIVTGGSSGIAKETAKHLLAHGALVIIGGKDEAKLRSAAADLGARIESGLWRETSRTRQPGSLLSKAPSSNWAASISW
jgi:NAD(P)-dependent dehydrogenase (short-subunit alcohol dehydrogenase family)